MTDFGFYLVMTAPHVGYAQCAEAAVQAKVPVLQLRMKHTPPAEILKVARQVREITRNTATTFIVNDDPELAVACHADGVHLGQDDLPIDVARRTYPQLSLFGLSTHNLEQVRQAHLLKPDYIGVGPVYATPTKDIPDPTLGLGLMQEMIAEAPCPAVAIGGINAERLPAVLQAGARNFAVVREVCQSPEPYEAILRLMRMLQAK